MSVTIPTDDLASFILSPVSEDLKTVPGITDEVIRRLSYNGITNTWALLGFFCINKVKNNYLNHIITCFAKFDLPPENEKKIIRACIMKLDTQMPGFFDLDTLY